MARRNIKLTIQYDGTEYHGWQVQPGLKTVQETICKAASDLLGRKVHVHGASRTDAGVHALGQAGLIQAETPIPTENIARALTGKLPHDISVTDAVDLPMGFDLIGDVTHKLYRYTIETDKIRPVMDVRYCWHLGRELDVSVMDAAAKALVGKYDFKSFASASDHRKSSVRTVFRCDVSQSGSKVCIDIEGDGFLYNMVRNITGTLVEIGLGRWEVSQIGAILEAKDRRYAGVLAPASGLCLMWIKYDGNGQVEA